MTIARRKAIDRLRASHRRHTLHENVATENAITVPEAVAPADDLLMQRDEGKRVRAALREIPAAQSAAIQLAFFSGLTQVEIAQKLAAPLGTIKARIRRSSRCGTDWRTTRGAPIPRRRGAQAS